MKPPTKSAKANADHRLTGGLSESARAARIQRLKENAPSVLQTKSRWTATHSMMGALGAAFAVAAIYYLMNIYDAAAQQQRVPDQQGLIRDVSMAEDWERDPLRMAAEEALAAAQARESAPSEPVETPQGDPSLIALGERLLDRAAPEAPELRAWEVELVAPDFVDPGEEVPAEPGL